MEGGDSSKKCFRLHAPGSIGEQRGPEVSRFQQVNDDVSNMAEGGGIGDVRW